MNYEYRIEGKYHDDITGEFIDRILEEFYVFLKHKGIGILPDNIKLVEKKVYYIQVDDNNDEALSKEIEKADVKRYGVTVDKTVAEVVDNTKQEEL